MPNDTIYDEKETPMLKDVINESFRAKLDEFCAKFLAAKSLEELQTLNAEAMEYIRSIISETNKPEVIKVMEIMEAVHLRMAVAVVLKDIEIMPAYPEKA